MPLRGEFDRNIIEGGEILTEYIYSPKPAVIKQVRQETPDIKTFELELKDKEEELNFIPGQYLEISVLGEGEFPVSPFSPPAEGRIELCVKKMGKVTTALHRLEVGETVWVRGPYGNGFPIKEWEGKKLILIGGGIGLPPLRSLLHYTMDEGKYRELMLIYGARSRKDLIREKELLGLRDEGVRVHLSIDRAEEGWGEFVGFVPANLLQISPPSGNSIAVTCGPPIMIKFVIKNLLELGFKPDQIFMTLEMKMKCGLGKCGRCNVGSVYVCRDGPVFSYERLKQLPQEY